MINQQVSYSECMHCLRTDSFDFQMQNFIQRKAMAQIESLADRKKGSEQLGAMMFAIKNISGSIDDLLNKFEGLAPSEKAPLANNILLQKSGATFTKEVCFISSLKNSSASLEAAIAADERNRKISELILSRLKGDENSQ